jgi:hypothetical protein
MIKYRQQQPLLFRYQPPFNKISIIINLTVFQDIEVLLQKILLKNQTLGDFNNF